MIIARSFAKDKVITLGRLSLSYSPTNLQHIELFKNQFVYGHREILLNYMSLDYSNLFLGTLQHGFQPTYEAEEAKTPRVEGVFKRSPLWVFSRERANYLQNLGFKNVFPIGAPWLYLPKSHETKSSSLKSQSYIVFPSHTNFTIPAPDDSQIRSKIRFWKKLAGKNILTICLYWSDFLEPGWQKIAREEEVKLTLAGLGGLEPVWSQHPTRINLLYKVRELMLQHTHVIFESFTSPIFYAISLNLSVGYFPEVLTPQELDRADIQDGKRWISENMPEIIGQFGKSKSLSERSDKMLGVDAMRSPAELQAILSPKEGVVPY